ncbi:Cytochrome P450 4C1 [Blattella germanica]|nr:Cytochrome P450 4C1 [Blattella germanica]
MVSSDVGHRFKLQTGLFKEFGNTFRLWIGPSLNIMTADPKVLERILGNPKLTKRGALAQRLLSSVLREGLVAINNPEKWKRHKKIVISNFHTKIVENFVDNFAKNSCILADRMEKIADGTTFDPYKYFAECAIDIVCETTMGTVVNAQLDNKCEYVKHTLKCLDLFGEISLRPWLWLGSFLKFTKYGKELRISSKYFHEFSADVIKKKLKEFEESGLSRKEDNYMAIPADKKIFLDLLIINSLMNEEEMLDEVTTLIVAGSETISTTCAYALSLLGDNQDVQERIFQEQKTIFGSEMHRLVTNEDLQKMVYLEQVIKETLRMFPPIPLASRAIDNDLKLDNNLTIPAGSVVHISFYSVHRNPEFYPDPDRFDPERFAPEKSKTRHPFSFLPFGGGRRKCVGNNYAILEAKAILSTLLRRLRVSKTVGGMEAIQRKLEHSFVLKPIDGFKVQLMPRNI